MSLVSASGFYDWKHMYEQISEHEKSPNHMKAYELWVESNKRIRLGRNENSENQEGKKRRVGLWREVFKRLIYVVEFLVFQKKNRKEKCTIWHKQWKLFKATCIYWKILRR
ncbi:hypothetical protein AVEN_143572-1 [Araneus ventricosus]|uniref:Uncharacterized protein n=1 Tax=Araneus ventricosus TaxID=182803 RepID=A0A4Y2AN56_ARAVE|nr:hypothetical protein AVEN_143572-1 [Araneus ventricosus]